MTEDRSQDPMPRAKDDDEDDVEGHLGRSGLTRPNLDSGSTESAPPDDGNPNPVERIASS